MTNENGFLIGSLNAWKGNLERADKLFLGLSPEQLGREIAPGKNRLIYLWGHLTAVHDRMLPLLEFGPRLFPEFDTPFITNPDRATPHLPSSEEVRKAWSEVNAKLSAGFAKLTPAEWLQRHTAVTEAEFAKEPHRNRFAILLSRTNHLSYHLGQAVLATK
jgi:hypothetical protein